MFIKLLLVMFACFLFVECDKNPALIDWSKTEDKEYWPQPYYIRSMISDNHGNYYGINDYSGSFFCKITLTKDFVVSRIDTINTAPYNCKLYKDKENRIIRSFVNYYHFTFDLPSGMPLSDTINSLSEYTRGYAFAPDSTLWIVTGYGPVHIYSWNGKTLKQEMLVQVNQYVRGLSVAASNDSVYVTCQFNDSSAVLTYDKVKTITTRSINLPSLTIINSFYAGATLYWNVRLYDTLALNVYNKNKQIISFKSDTLAYYPILLKRDNDQYIVEDILEGSRSDGDLLFVKNKVFIPGYSGIKMFDGKTIRVLKLPFSPMCFYKDSLDNAFVYNPETSKFVKIDTTQFTSKPSYVYPY